jgi:hypothetical protein
LIPAALSSFGARDRRLPNRSGEQRDPGVTVLMVAVAEAMIHNHNG